VWAAVVDSENLSAVVENSNRVPSTGYDHALSFLQLLQGAYSDSADH
jgi:hypothetical protein